MKVFKEIRFRDLPASSRIWIKPTCGRFKNVWCFGIKTDDQVRIEDTNQIIYPKRIDFALVADHVNTDLFPTPIIEIDQNLLQTIKTENMSTTKKIAKKSTKKVAKKVASKKVAKKTAGRKANAESLASKIKELHLKGKTNEQITAALGCPNKYVCDVTWRVHNVVGGGKKK